MVLLQGEQQEQRQEVEPLVGKLALLPLFQPLGEMETAKMNVSSNAISPSSIQTCNPLNTVGQHFHLFHPGINTTTQFITAYYYMASSASGQYASNSVF